MKKLLPIALVAVLIHTSCTEQKEKIANSEKESALVSPSQPTEEKQTATVSPLTMGDRGPLTNEAKEQELLKKLSVKDLFVKNMPFTENKGQLEKWYNIRIEKIGDVKFYTQAFGGTAYFGKAGIGIGFHVDQLNDAYHKTAAAINPEEEEDEEEEHHGKKKQSLFFYIDHAGSNKDVSLEGWNPKEGKVNYFKGKESDFITDISNYDGVLYKGLYENIDLKYSYDGQLVYDYIVKPGGRVADIKRNFSDVKKIQINAQGELEVHTSWGILTDKKIYAYQLVNGRQQEVKVRYKKLSDHSAGYEVTGRYDKTKTLIIDPPTLTFATFVTSSGHNGYIYDLAIDATGDIYATGWSNGAFTLVAPFFDNTPTGGEAFVLKLKSDGTTLLYASFIGGDGIGGDNEAGFGIAVNSAKQAYVAGFTDVTANFPTAGTPLQAAVAGSKDIFVVKINAAGNGLIYSTFYGGTGDDRAFGVAVNSSDEAFITGWTTSTTAFSTAGAYKTTNGGGGVGYDAFVLKISDPTAGTVVNNYCTYFGGSSDDMARSIAVSGGDVFITGVTQSTNLPKTVGASFGGGGGGGAFDAFITRINGATGNNLVYCTYVGGDFDEKAEGIAVLSSTNEAYITGWTKSILRGTVAAPNPGAFPVVNAITGYTQNGNPAGNTRDAFMTHVSATGTILNSTFMGVAGDDNLKNGNPFDPLNQHRSGAIAVDPAGNVAVVMATDDGGATLPTIASVDATFNGGAVGLGDAYLFVLSSDAQTIVFSTFLGGDGNDYPTAGVKFDANDCIIFGGTSHSTNFPTTAGVVNTTRLSGTANDEYYVTKFCTIILPVELLTFAAHLDQNNAIIEWSTASEKNNDHFEVERSIDGVNFTTIGIVKGAGNSSELVNYSLPDKGLTAPVVYYRLKQVDQNAAYTYSQIITVYPQRPQTIFIKAINSGIFEITKDVASQETIDIRVIDALGRTVYEFQGHAATGVFEKMIDLNKLASGVYIIQVTSGDEKKTEKVVLNQ